MTGRAQDDREHGARKLVSTLPIQMSVPRCTVGFMEAEQNDETNKMRRLLAQDGTPTKEEN